MANGYIPHNQYTNISVANSTQHHRLYRDTTTICLWEYSDKWYSSPCTIMHNIALITSFVLGLLLENDNGFKYIKQLHTTDRPPAGEIVRTICLSIIYVVIWRKSIIPAYTSLTQIKYQTHTRLNILCSHVQITPSVTGYSGLWTIILCLQLETHTRSWNANTTQRNNDYLCNWDRLVFIKCSKKDILR